MFQGTLTLGNAKARLTPEVQYVWLVRALCSLSSMACFLGPGTDGRGGLRHSTEAHERVQAWSADVTVTVCGGFTLNSG